jgi:hypothetical protein
MHHSQHQSSSYGGIHCVTTKLQHLEAGLARFRLSGNHNAERLG